ncbi:MAG: AMP-binding protein [Bacillota bacterium]|nr:AMP-binding protein [Bacillota bacterium]
MSSAITEIKAPWLEHYGEVPFHLDYPRCTMLEMVEEVAGRYPELEAYSFLGKGASYKKMVEQIHQCARAFRALGIREGDRVTLCLPNSPQAVVSFYALNAIGAVANMIHPLSGQKEIAFYLKDSGSAAAVTLDQFYGKFAAIRQEAELPRLIITSVKDALGGVKKVGYALTEGRKIPPLPADADMVLWKDFLAGAEGWTGEYRAARGAGDPAAILYSGGTTGTTKGILLSNLNFNALARQIDAMSHCFQPGRTMLAVMPMFHGFGLGVCIHSMLANGGRCLLVPRFNAASYARLLKKERPNYIAGVPTLYEAILRQPDMQNIDLSCLLGVFSGGDSLSIELKKKFDKFLAEHNASVQIREGYGTTECVTASCLTPYHTSREGSIGFPFPDTYYKIVKPETTEELPYGEEGEICLSGPTVMIEYVNHPQETADTLKVHADGRTWLHTGDLGTMDADGYIYFRQRMKRMIVSSGYNIYPSQLENVIDSHEKVFMSCVIGVPDELKIQKVKAFVMLAPGVEPGEEIRQELLEHCRLHIARYAMPYDIEFRDQLPKTLVGKVAYKILEEQELLRIRQEKEAAELEQEGVPARQF